MRYHVGVTKETNVKLPYHRDFVLTYLVENEMPLVHHAIKW